MTDTAERSEVSAARPPNCICGHSWDAHDGHTVLSGSWPPTHCSQPHALPNNARCERYYPSAAPYEPSDAEVERALRAWENEHIDGLNGDVAAMNRALRAAWGGEAQGA